jgi:tripartite-type tricarboxylate transporter receptor subunit TctC
MRWALFSLAFLCAVAFAQPYPARPVKLIVPFPPGSTPDIVGRTLAARLQETFAQPMVVENRSGAGGNVGTEAVAKAPADGYTLLIGINGPVATNKYLYPSLPYDPQKDLAPISLLASAPQMLVVVPELKLDGFRGFLDYARANPGRISYGSVGSGSASHLTMELLKSEAKIYAVHIPYRGFPPAVTDMLAGNIHAMFAIIPGVLPHVKAGRLKALAVTALKRSRIAAARIARLDRVACAGGHAARGARAAKRRDRTQHARCGSARAPRRAGLRCRRELPGRIRALDTGRIWEVVARHPNEWRHRGLMNHQEWPNVGAKQGRQTKVLRRAVSRSLFRRQ